MAIKKTELQRVLGKLSDNLDERKLSADLAVKEIDLMAESTHAAMTGFGNKISSEIKSVADKTRSDSSNWSIKQIDAIEELIMKSEATKVLTAKQSEILRKQLDITKAAAGGAEKYDEGYFRAGALSDVTYEIGKAIRTEGGFKQLGEKAGKKLLGGEEKFNVQAFKNIAKRMAGIGLMGLGVAQESPGMLLIGKTIQDSVDRQDAYLTEQQKELQALVDEPVSELGSELLEEYAKTQEEADTSRGEATTSGLDNIVNSIDEQSNMMLDQHEEGLGSDVLDRIYKEVADIRTLMHETGIYDLQFQKELLDMKKDDELSRVRAEAPSARTMPTPLGVPMFGEEGEKGEATSGLIGTLAGTLGGNIAAKLGPKMMPHLAKAGGMMAAAAGPAIGIAMAAGVGLLIGKAINVGLKKWLGPGGLGGEIFDWISGDAQEQAKKAREGMAGASELAATGTVQEIQARQAEVATEISQLETKLSNIGAVGKFFATDTDEIARIAELKSQQSRLQRGINVRTEALAQHADQAPMRGEFETANNQPIVIQDNSTAAINTNGAGRTEDPGVVVTSGDSNNMVNQLNAGYN